MRYICNDDSDRRARRYANFFAKEQEVWLRLKNTYFPKRKIRARPDQATLTVLAKQFTNPYRWSGHDTRYLAQEPDTNEFDSSGNPATQVFDYEVIYGWTSRFVHPTVAAVDSHLGSRERVHFALLVLRRLGSATVTQPFFNVVLFLSKIFIYVFEPSDQDCLIVLESELSP